ncbi:MAG: hypothetical protein HAW63_02775 [Bdellovibrionaceae bacterium]|nr:hypothetical protein [Pseudobdellovibrionaceae bacterium]
MKYFSLFFLYSLTLISCNLPLDTQQNSHQLTTVPGLKIEKCKVTKALQDESVLVSVQTKYKAKIYSVRNLQKIPFLGPSLTEEKNIRYANYTVFNSTGAVVLCGNTGESGSFTITLTANEQYTIKIYSHILSSNIANVAVMQSPKKSKSYFIQKTFNTSDTTSINLVSQLPVNYKSRFETNNSGAFNILDQIVASNLFLKKYTKNCSLCASSFNNPPFLEVYWKSGFNPNQYFRKSNPVSFFINFRQNNTPYYRLFLLGGMNKISDAKVDTDEFDNSVIIHEYAHFLMSAFSKDSSTGGPHYGVESIDPRLAWSEGIADFFQAAVLNKGVYLDVAGVESIIVPFENQGARGIQDKPNITGEGNYREFSIARFFWDIIDSGDNYNANTNDDDSHNGEPADFQEIWDVITSPIFKSQPTVSMGLFNEVQNSKLFSSSVPWSDLRTLHLQHNPVDEFFRSLYGLQLSTNCNTLTPTLQFTELQTSTLNENLMLQKKRVLEYNHRSAGPVLLGLKYPVKTNVDNNPLIKFYIQNKRFSMENNLSSMYEKKSTSDEQCTTQGYKQCLYANLKKGRYLIEVISKNSNASAFQFFADGTELCGENTTAASLISNSVPFNKKLPFSSKLTPPFALNLKAKKQEGKSIYQVEAIFTNKNFSLKNIQLQWRYSDNIKIISGDTEKVISSALPQEQIKMTLLIQATEALEQSNIYFLAKANYNGRTLPQTLAFTLKQLIRNSEQTQNGFLQTNKVFLTPKPKPMAVPENAIIKY